jgi:hypothetical protein
LAGTYKYIANPVGFVPKFVTWTSDAARAVLAKMAATSAATSKIANKERRDFIVYLLLVWKRFQNYGDFRGAASLRPNS